MSEDKKAFTVNDRRAFTNEGERREETGETTPATGTADRGDAPQNERTRPVDFGSFLLSLGAQGSLLLRGPGVAEPGSGPDLEGARSIISILEMLKDKTEGRRTQEEDRLLESILYELRMGYVSCRGVGGGV